MVQTLTQTGFQKLGTYSNKCLKEATSELLSKSFKKSLKERTHRSLRMAIIRAIQNKVKKNELDSTKSEI